MKATSERCCEPGQHVLTRDLALLDLRDTPLGDTHTVGHLLLGKPTGPAHLGKPVSDHHGQEFLLASLDRLLPASPSHMLSPNPRPPNVSSHRFSPSSSPRSFR